MIVGVLGGGQLARMLALAGTPLGLRFRCLDPSPDAVAGHVAELVVADYRDEAALARFVAGVQVVTFEFENVPARAAQWLAEHATVAPVPRALEIGQDRVFEKRLFASVGMATAQHRAADTRADLHSAVAAVGAPCIVKTHRLGYDGKGQVRLVPVPSLSAAIDAAFDSLRPAESGGLVVEQMVAFDREVSVLAARNGRGEVMVYPLVENEHEGGILARSRAPAPNVPEKLVREAGEFVSVLLRELDYVGLLAVEMFLKGDRWIANELAPRVHNSGHWTIEGAECSQFENHLRAILDLPLGSTAMTAGGHATMVNLIGSLPARADVLAIPGVHLHAYGKAARPGRKVGHATALAADRATADALCARVAALPRSSGSGLA